MAVPRAQAAEPPYRIHRYPSVLIDRVTLADGRRVTVRPVLPQDAEAEQSFISALSRHSRRLRFHGAVNQLPEATLRGMTVIDYRDHVALVAEVVDAEDGLRLVADARYAINEAGIAEFAIAVADDWQHVGLGRTLLQRLACFARGQGIERLEGAVMAGNAPMLGLMRRWGASLRADPEDAAVLIVTLRCG